MSIVGTPIRGRVVGHRCCEKNTFAEHWHQHDGLFWRRRGTARV